MKKKLEMKKDGKGFERFDDAMAALLSVPYAELQGKLEEENRLKKRPKTASHASDEPHPKK